MTNPLQYYTQLVYYGTKLLPDIEVVKDIVINILIEGEEDINILYLTVRNRCIAAGGDNKELNIEYELIEVAMLEELSKQNNMLSEKLKDQISNEGETISAKFKDTNDYLSGRIQGFNEGYEAGGFKYAEKWQEEKELRERYEKALKAIAKPIAYLQQKAEEEGASLDGYFAQELARSAAFLQSLADEALTPKTSTDELHKEP